MSKKRSHAGVIFEQIWKIFFFPFKKNPHTHYTSYTSDNHNQGNCLFWFKKQKRIGQEEKKTHYPWEREASEVKLPEELPSPSQVISPPGHAGNRREHGNWFNRVCISSSVSCLPSPASGPTDMPLPPHTSLKARLPQGCPGPPSLGFLGGSNPSGPLTCNEWFSFLSQRL